VELETGTDPAVEGPQNQPMMPVAWTRTFTGASGKSARVFTTTMGASQDLQNESFRRLLVNAVYWTLGMEMRIPKMSNVELVGEYKPSTFKFNGFKRGMKLKDLLSPP
jgi:hypothetical protein